MGSSLIQLLKYRVFYFKGWNQNFLFGAKWPNHKLITAVVKFQISNQDLLLQLSNIEITLFVLTCVLHFFKLDQWYRIFDQKIYVILILIQHQLCLSYKSYLCLVVFVIVIQLFGGWCLTVCCGVFGGNGILEALRVTNGPFLSLSLFIFILLEWCLVLPSFSCLSLPVLFDHCNLVS